MKTALAVSPILGHCEQQSINGHAFAASNQSAPKNIY